MEKKETKEQTSKNQVKKENRKKKWLNALQLEGRKDKNKKKKGKMFQMPILNIYLWTVKYITKHTLIQSRKNHATEVNSLLWLL